MAADIRKCSFPTCEKYVNKPYDNDYCIYHAPKKNKGLSAEAFNRLIAAQLRRQDFNFKGYIFPGEIAFPKIDEQVFSQNAKFTRAQFLDTVKFVGCQFEGYADFRGAQFHGAADFRDSRFDRLAVFNKSRFHKIVAFDRVKFNGDADFLFAQFASSVLFRGAKFSEDVNFDSAEFAKNFELGGAEFYKNVAFQSCVFKENTRIEKVEFHGTIDFNKTQFLADANFSNLTFSGAVDFNDTHFHGETTLNDLRIKDCLNFNRIKLQNSCIFKMSSPRFIDNHETNKIIKFSNIIFNPDRTFFEDFNRKLDTNDVDLTAIVLFRYCNLKDAIFFNNNLGLFSFFNSTFDQARFISNRWQSEKSRWLPYEKRKNILLDEILFIRLKNRSGILKKNFLNNYQLQHLDSYEVIASLYHRMKTALDNNKDYNDASWFHFNELEMRRQKLRESIKLASFLKGLPDRIRYFALSNYKAFAGYGEKPLKSFNWFIFFAFIFFPLVHIGNGLTVKSTHVLHKMQFLQTDVSFLLKNEFVQNFLYAVNFSLFRLIPFDYLPLEYLNVPDGPFGLFWAFANSITLISLVIFTGLGLKNHFRRF